jgi:hypothetical protein
MPNQNPRNCLKFEWLTGQTLRKLAHELAWKLAIAFGQSSWRKWVLSKESAVASPNNYLQLHPARSLLSAKVRNPKLERKAQRLAAQSVGSGRNEDNAMITNTKQDSDILELLKSELSFIEQGGYGRSVRTPWLPKSVFQDSLTCINFSDPNRTEPCSACELTKFVSADHQAENVPCHFIALNDAGETIEDLEAQDNQAKLEATLKQWMRTMIEEIEGARLARTATMARQEEAAVWSKQTPTRKTKKRKWRHDTEE